MSPLLFALLLCFGPEGQSPQTPPSGGGARQVNAKGLEVISVVADSQALKLKFQPGDILVAYNETPLNTFDNLREALKKAKPKDNVLQVFRAGKIYAIKVAGGKLGLELAER